MTRPPRHRWPIEDLDTVRQWYPIEGRAAVATRLPHRTKAAIMAKAKEMGLRGPKKWRNAPPGNCSGEQLERAIALYEQGNISWTDIGFQVGCSGMSAQNAVLVAMCPRLGFEPAERNEQGWITPAGIERLRELMRQGKKGVEIQLEAGVTASVASRERRAYERELAAQGLPPLPARNDGLPYSGVRVSDEVRRRVESYLLQGFGIIIAGRRSGVGQQSVKLIRKDLVRRLHAVGVALPGCDVDGNRIEMITRHPKKKTDEEIQTLRRLLASETMTVPEAAPLANMSLAAAYSYARQFALEAEAIEGDVIESMPAAPATAPTDLAAPAPEPKGRLADLPAATAPAAAQCRSANVMLRQVAPPPPDDAVPSSATDRQANRVIVAHGRLPMPPDPLAKRGTRPVETPVPGFSPEFLERLRRVAAGQGIVEVQPINRPPQAFSGGGSSLAGI